MKWMGFNNLGRLYSKVFKLTICKVIFDKKTCTKIHSKISCWNFWWHRTHLQDARHYNPRFVLLFTPFFFFTEVYITDHLRTKNENSSFFQPKIRGLYMRAVSDQERVIMARVRYIKLRDEIFFYVFFLLKRRNNH